MAQVSVNPDDSGYRRLEGQIEWYDARSASSKRAFKWLKTATIGTSVAIPVFAAFSAYRGMEGKSVALVTAIMGGVIALLEGLQQLNQYNQNWISYRSTAEALKHEKYLFMGKAGSYATALDRNAVLAERVESLVSQEHAKWSMVQEQLGKSGNSRSKTEE